MNASRLASVGLLAATFLSCSSAPVSEKQEGATSKLARDVKEECDVGRAMAAKLAGTLGWYDENPQTLKYVNMVGQSLAARSSRPELAFHFGILKSDEINAMATPGGYIFVTLGLLRAVRNESELAGILSHEIAHVTERHMYKAIMPERSIGAGETVTRMLSRGGSDYGHSLSAIVNAGMDLLLEKGLGQEKEEEADRGGVVLAASSGYDPHALDDFLTRIGRNDSTVKVSKTHPPFPARLKSLEAFLTSNGLKKGALNASATRLEQRFKTATGGKQT